MFLETSYPVISLNAFLNLGKPVFLVILSLKLLKQQDVVLEG